MSRRYVHMTKEEFKNAIIHANKLGGQGIRVISATYIPPNSATQFNGNVIFQESADNGTAADSTWPY